MRPNAKPCPEARFTLFHFSEILRDYKNTQVQNTNSMHHLIFSENLRDFKEIKSAKRASELRHKPDHSMRSSIKLIDRGTTGGTGPFHFFLEQKKTRTGTFDVFWAYCYWLWIKTLSTKESMKMRHFDIKISKIFWRRTETSCCWNIWRGREMWGWDDGRTEFRSWARHGGAN